MHPAIFIPAWVILGVLFALQNWLNLRRWGYHMRASVLFTAWGTEFLIWGILFWLLWRFLRTFVVRANAVDMLTKALPLSLTLGVVKEMIWVLLFPNVPLDRPHMAYLGTASSSIGKRSSSIA